MAHVCVLLGKGEVLAVQGAAPELPPAEFEEIVNSMPVR